MFECPKCGDMLADDALICNHCKWTAKNLNRVPGERRKTITIHGREFSVKLCAHIDRGQECSEIARFSMATNGSGPFWCDKHFPPFSGRYSKEITTPPMGFQALKDVAQKTLRPPREPGEEG